MNANALRGHASVTKVVYIAGAGRSGGTLFEYLLAQRFGLFPVGELVFVWERGFQQNQLCSCGEPFLSCRFWAGVVEDAYGKLSQDDVAHIRALHTRVARTRALPRLVAGGRFQPSY